MRLRESTHKPCNLLLRGHLTNENSYICTYTAPMATTFSRIVTWDEGILLAKLSSYLLTFLSRYKIKYLFLHSPKTYGY